MTKAYTVSTAPSQISQPALPDHLAQHPAGSAAQTREKTAGVGLITFSA